MVVADMTPVYAAAAAALGVDLDLLARLALATGADDALAQRIRDGNLAEGGNDLVRAALAAHLVRHGEEITNLRREDLEPRRANEILRKASAFFAAELDRPTTR